MRLWKIYINGDLYRECGGSYEAGFVLQRRYGFRCNSMWHNGSIKVNNVSRSIFVNDTSIKRIRKRIVK